MRGFRSFFCARGCDGMRRDVPVRAVGMVHGIAAEREENCISGCKGTKSFRVL